MDRFYTPPGLAALLVGAAKGTKVSMVADFAVGDGALLRAASTRWSGAQLFGSDIDPDALTAGFGLPSKPAMAVHDFLSEDAPPNSLATLRGRCDLVLLNPPFTCRGNRLYQVNLQGRVLRGSKALAFVARSLEYLAKAGEVLAIVPASCLTSARDAELLDALRADYAVQQIGEINRNAFAECSVSVVIIRLKRRHRLLPIQFPRRQTMKPVVMRDYNAELMRGSLSVHDARRRSGSVPCIHSTDLKDGQLATSKLSVRPHSRVVQGTVILLPRVGRPSLSKLILATVDQAILTDCVFALRTSPPGREDALLRLMRANWSQLEKAYGGSCAPYLTQERLKATLLGWGVGATIVSTIEQRTAGDISDDRLAHRRA